MLCGMWLCDCFEYSFDCLLLKIEALRSAKLQKPQVVTFHMPQSAAKPRSDSQISQHHRLTTVTARYSTTFTMFCTHDKSVNRNSSLYRTSISSHSRYTAKNCGDKMVALYRRLTPNLSVIYVHWRGFRNEFLVVRLHVVWGAYVHAR
jgi:hypothetical protein